MQFTSLLSVATFAAAAMAASVQVNFYSDTGCQNFIGSRFIDFDPSRGGTHHSGGPAGSRGGLFVNSNGDNLAFRGFSNHPDGSSPFTGNVVDGECIVTLNGVVAVFIV
ncbi:hypothetical protein FOQG_11240 [Fusarium oxysporum f. sp. raphani 54005]|uniref:Uncharacterized protein n=2 Tax=Fusarium oxysporum TaxID=5507 RepID=X0CQF2_FUSOX|nr:hypothetical protein FOVG_12424 [Fusarium oxysporum f. sp. pisi HDV247]EXK84717.1 hypothetical protein FOQG_11240 [Fusarium oxysporum f. sp. raphani 54005]KAJ4049496.1 hypothetical protein NW753_008519 [Fusarium oxysporum]KAJ4050080.1 hypothetical protein NW763_009404 [Fusarium oxysporum]KAJ4090377.1 hypothetical protein NW756_006739 [Fusarium oxysporum]